MKKDIVIEIFANLGFKVVDDVAFKNVIVMNAEDAFTFSAITGSKYLFYQNGITMKGRN